MWGVPSGRAAALAKRCVVFNYAAAMAELFTFENLAALVTLTAMEIVLGIDNIVFIAILTGKLPPERRATARRVGLFLAMFALLNVGAKRRAAWREEYWEKGFGGDGVNYYQLAIHLQREHKVSLDGKQLEWTRLPGYPLLLALTTDPASSDVGSKHPDAIRDRVQAWMKRMKRVNTLCDLGTARKNALRAHDACELLRRDFPIAVHEDDKRIALVRLHDERLHHRVHGGAADEHPLVALETLGFCRSGLAERRAALAMLELEAVHAPPQVAAVEGDAGGSRLIVSAAGGEILVPLAVEICTSIAPEARRIVIAPPEGLLELNVSEKGNRKSQK